MKERGHAELVEAVVREQIAAVDAQIEELIHSPKERRWFGDTEDYGANKRFNDKTRLLEKRSLLRSVISAIENGSPVSPRAIDLLLEALKGELDSSRAAGIEQELEFLQQMRLEPIFPEAPAIAPTVSHGFGLAAG